MSQPVIAVVPLDDRAVNYECLQLLGAAAGFKMILPPKEWLGTPWRAGEIDRWSGWLSEQATRADAFIVAIDTIGYGGLVNSRRSTDSLSVVSARLEALLTIKAAHPDTMLLAYSVLMRVNRGNDADEEKAYWADYGSQLFRLSVLEDRVTMAVAAPDEVHELLALRQAVPGDVVADYLAGRARNHAVNRLMIDWTAAGVFDYLIVPQDDTVAYGWNMAEARMLNEQVRTLGLSERVSIYPGADETAMLLLARYAAQRMDFRPRVWVRFSGACADDVITAYEDRPMPELVKAHLGPLAGVCAAAPGEADILLYVNAPAEGQGDGPDQWPLSRDAGQLAALSDEVRSRLAQLRLRPGVAQTLREMHTVRRNLPEFVRSLGNMLDAGLTCAVADVAFVNAADVALADLLFAESRISQLAAFGGWNTAGNTLGSVLAQAVIRHLQRVHGAKTEQLAAHVRLLFLRLVEDAIYMARLRSEIMYTELPQLGLAPTMGNLGDAAPVMRTIGEQRLRASATDLARRRFIGHTVTARTNQIVIDDLDLFEVELPWGRLFDLTMDVALR